MECGEAVAECGYLGEELEVGLMGDGKAVSHIRDKSESDEASEERDLYFNGQRAMIHAHRRAAVVYGRIEKPLLLGASAEGSGGITVKWGDPKGPEVDWYIGGSLGDKKGNQVNVRVDGKEDGTGTVNVNASTKSKEKGKNN